jgi:hypothetical protein
MKNQNHNLFDYSDFKSKIFHDDPVCNTNRTNFTLNIMYDDKDLKTILSRAIQIQTQNEGNGSLSGSIEKLSLSEIEEIARESGLSPDYVREAAIELEGIPIEKPFFLETDKSHEIELLGYAKGAIDQKSWAELRSVIEEDFKTSGVVRRYSDGIQWTVKPAGIFKIFKSMNSTCVELQYSGFRTVIRIKKKLKLYRRLLYPAYASLAGSVMLFAILLQNGNTNIILGIAAFLGIAKLFFNWANHVKEKSKSNLQDTLSQLQTIINRKHKAHTQEFSRSILQIDEDPADSNTHSTDQIMKNPVLE